MYLSRIKLNTTIRNTMKFLSSPQVAHATIEASFADDDQSRKLWRLDHYRGQAYILLLSQEKPVLDSFISQFGYTGDTGEIRDYQGVLNQLANKQVYRFRLCANPVHSLKQADGTRGKIAPHVTIAQQEEWLRRKSEKLGFTLGEFTVVQRDTKKFKRQHALVTISTATYEGILTITDAAVFKTTLTQGIGRAKSYGCGLLTLAR